MQSWTDGIQYRVHNLIIKNIYMYISIMQNFMDFFLDTYFFFNRYFQAGEIYFFLIIFKVFFFCILLFCIFFSKRNFKVVPNTSGSATTTGETGETGQGREREGGRDHSTSREKKGTATLLFGNHKQKMHSSGLKRLNQTPTPVCTGIYSGASCTGHTHTHTHPDTDRQQKQ